MKQTKSILIDHELWNKFKQRCQKKELVMGDVIADLVAEYMRKIK